jgi:N-methylhydantoinase B/oxoprolinase/acetone carboxylase alpha subunit
MECSKGEQYRQYTLVDYEKMDNVINHYSKNNWFTRKKFSFSPHFSECFQILISILSQTGKVILAHASVIFSIKSMFSTFKYYL